MEVITPRAHLTPITETQPQNSPPGGVPISGTIPGQISREEALRGGEGAKIDPLSLGRISDAAAGGSHVSLGSLLEAKLVLEVVDSLLPAALVLIFHAAKIQLNKSVFQLTAKEKDVLSPIVQKCLESVNLNFDSPWIALAVTMGAFYIAKGMEHVGKARIDQKNEAKKNASVKTNTTEAELQEKAKKLKDKLSVVKDVPEILREWDEDDIIKVIKKRRKGRIDALDWLAKNWVKTGGVV